MKAILIGDVLSAWSSAAFAQAAPAAPADPWSGRVGLGFAAITGNAKSSSVAGDFSVKYDAVPWHHEGMGNGYRATATDQATDRTSTTGERYTLGYKLKYDFKEFDYVFGLLGYDRDLFSGYRRQLSEVVGYGRRLLNSPKQVLNLEVGAGAKQSDLSDGTNQDQSLGRFAGEYILKLGQTGQFSQKLSTEVGHDNTYSEAVTALSTTLVKKVGLSLTYTVRDNSNVPVGTQRTDTFTAITLQYTF